MNLLGSFLPYFMAKHPYIELKVHVGGSSLMESMLSGRDLDICFSISTSDHCLPGIAKNDIYFDKECIIVSKNHPFARRAEVDIRELNGEVLVMTAENPSDVIQKRTKGLMETFSLQFSRCLTADSIESQLLYVDSGQGISIFPWKDRSIIFGNTVAIPLSNVECSLTVSIFYRMESANPAIQIFVNDFNAFCSSNGG